MGSRPETAEIQCGCQSALLAFLLSQGPVKVAWVAVEAYKISCPGDKAITPAK